MVVEDGVGILELIRSYYEPRGLQWPLDADEALMWVLTELGGVMELLLARRGEWVRNCPDEHREFSKVRLAEELGDVVMMVLVAGMVEGVDLLEVLREKLVWHSSE